MKYHARLVYGVDREEIAINFSQEQIFHSIAVPYILGQVVDVPIGDQIYLVNMKAVVRLSFYQTEWDLHGLEVFDRMDGSLEDCTSAIIGEVRKQLAQPNVRGLFERAFAQQKNQAFVVMKFGDEQLDSAYNGVVKPLFCAFGLHPVRIDELENSGKIDDQNLDEIAASKVVFADLSGARPNCYYETGYAHALGKTLILSIHENEEAHFDLRGYRFIVWRTEFDLRQKLTSRLRALLPLANV